MKAAIFDVDGTLLDSMGAWEHIGEKWLEGIGVKADEGLGKRLQSMSMADSADCMIAIARNALGADCSALTREAVIDGVVSLLNEFYRNEVKCKPHAREFLHSLHERAIPCAVATANDRRLITDAFKRLRLDEFLSGIFTCGELDTTKDDSSIYITASRSLCARVCDTVLFEDSAAAADVASRAGFTVVGVLDESGKGEWDKLRAVCRMVLSDYSQFDWSLFD